MRNQIGVASRGKSEAYRQLGEPVREELTDLARANKPLPEPATRPMREAVLT
jgi:hypothetical protein